MAARVRSDVPVSSPGIGFGSPAFDRHAKAPPAWDVLEKGRATLDALMHSWSLPALGVAKLLDVLAGDPVSRVRATPRSVAVHFPSPKMGRVIQAASRTVEYAFVHYCEYDPEVLLYLDQPLTVEIRIVDTLGRSRPVPYTCDYCVVRSEGVTAYECKPLEWLQKQSQKPNPRYVYDPDAGVWRHPAAEEAFRAYGFAHRVFHSGDVNVRWMRNVRFLADFIFIDPPAGADEARAALRRHQSLSFAEACCVPGTSREAWFWLIASGRAAFDLEREVVDRPDLLALASVHDSHGAMACHRLALDSRDDAGVVPSLCDSAVLCLDPGVAVLFRDLPHQVVSRDVDQVVLCAADPSCEGGSPHPVVIPVDSVPALVDSGHLRAVTPTPEERIAQRSRSLLARATNDERLRALKRWSALCQYRETGSLPSSVGRAAVFEYQRWADAAAKREGSEFLGMIRLRDTSADRRGLSPEQVELLREVADAFHRGKYASGVDADGVEHRVPSRRRVSSAYADYLRLSRERGLKPCGSRTLRREIDRYSMEESERARRGDRAAYRFSASVLLLRNALPVHGTRVFEVGSVDHQLLDLWCVSGATGALLGRPWLTLIIDEFSHMPVGFTLRFDPPCVYSVLCAIFDCIVRHGRFVDALVSDQGIEFESPDLGVALAYCRTAHVRRPPSKPRFGAQIERCFGSLKTRLIDELSGSIDTVARSREVSTTHDPQRHALWTLPAVSRLIETCLFQICPRLIHRALGATHREVFDFSNDYAGERVARHILVDDTLRLALSETVPGKDGTRTVPKKGGPITVGYLPFHHPEFSNAAVLGRAVPVRRCSADASFVYVFLPHRRVWEPARLVSGSIDLTESSWRQARALLEEGARQRLVGSLGSAEDANALVMSDLLLSVDEYEREALERRYEIDEAQQHESRLRLGAASDSATPAMLGDPAPAQAPAPDDDSVAPPFNLPEPMSYDEFDD